MLKKEKKTKNYFVETAYDMGSHMCFVYEHEMNEQKKSFCVYK